MRLHVRLGSGTDYATLRNHQSQTSEPISPQPFYKGITDCFRRIYTDEGVTAFYRGTLSPLLGIGAQVALQFGTNELVKKILFKLSV